MVAQQKIKDSSVETTTETKPGSPTSRLAMLKRSNKPKKDDANDPFRFQGNGVDFKGKLIGEQDVSEARGDQMCAEAMRAAKMAVKQAGSHKQRVSLNISIDGIKIKDEKSGAILFNFNVAKISFIARDTTDARAFGFIFGNEENKYKFYGIKTAQTADNAVLAIRDMFQVVFEMKKKQIQEMKQKKEQETQENLQKENNFRIEDGVACADLLDLETELEVIKQGYNSATNPFVAAPVPFETQASTVNPFAARSTPVVDPFNTFSNTADPFNTPANRVDLFAAPPLTTVSHNKMDPFDTQSAHRVISAINTTQSYGLPPPPQRQPPALDFTFPSMGSTASSMNDGSNGQASPEINWGVSASSASSFKENSFKENSAPVANNNSFDLFANDFNQFTNDFNKAEKVTTLEDAFAKLVDMDKLVPLSNPPAETKKNPFEHIINPPKLSINAMTPASVPSFNAPSQPQLVNGGRDPFNDDFFN